MKKIIGMLLFFVFWGGFMVVADQADTSSSKNIETILNKTGNKPYILRQQAVHGLPARISEEDQMVLIGFLYTPPSTDSSLNELELAAIKNDLTARLIRVNPDAVADALIEMSGMAAVGDVWRNYCYQFTAMLYDKVSMERRSMLDSALTDILAHPETLYVGTALIAVKNISILPGSSVWRTNVVIEKAKTIYNAKNVLPMNKQAAFQILGEFGDPKTRVIARKILTDPASSILEKVSSLAILGKQGTAEDITLLDTFRKHPEPRLSRAAEINYQRLSNTLKSKK